MSTAALTYGTAVHGSAVVPPLRLTKRGRRVLLALVTVPVIVIAIVVAFSTGSRASASTDPATLTYVSVSQGQSLWQLAEQIAPKADPRDVIDELVSLNSLDSIQVQAGQRLAIPSQYAAAHN